MPAICECRALPKAYSCSPASLDPFETWITRSGVWCCGAMPVPRTRHQRREGPSPSKMIHPSRQFSLRLARPDRHRVPSPPLKMRRRVFLWIAKAWAALIAAAGVDLLHKRPRDIAAANPAQFPPPAQGILALCSHDHFKRHVPPAFAHRPSQDGLRRQNLRW